MKEMTVKTTSWKLKVIAWVSIIVSVWMLFLLVNMLTILEYRYQIPMGALIFGGVAVLSLLAAGIVTLKSLKMGMYLYVVTSIIWLLQVILHLLIVEQPQTLPAGITAFIRHGGTWLLLGILGIIVCFYEIKRLSKINHEPGGN